MGGQGFKFSFGQGGQQEMSQEDIQQLLKSFGMGGFGGFGGPRPGASLRTSLRSLSTKLPPFPVLDLQCYLPSREYDTFWIHHPSAWSFLPLLGFLSSKFP